jgi:hypothetical protein
MTISWHNALNRLSGDFQRGFGKVRHLRNTQVGGTIAKNIDHDDIGCKASVRF